MLLEDDALWPALARNPNSGVPTLQFLASQSEVLAVTVVGNPSCPRALLSSLVHHSSVAVRSAVAHHKRTSPFLLKILSTDSSPAVRMACLEGPNVRLSLVQTLALDPDSQVRAAALAYISRFEPEIADALVRDHQAREAARVRMARAH